MSKSEPQIMLELLRELLRKRGLRYREIAQNLGVTERTVTRWFSTDRIDTRTVDQLCELAGISFFNLCELAANRVENRESRLSVSQEQSLADDPLLRYLFSQILRGWSAAELGREADIPQSDLVAALIRLERLGLIALLPGNEIQLRTAVDIDWAPNGPVTKSTNQWLNWVLDAADVGEPDAAWAVDALKLSANSLAQLKAKFHQLRQDARDLSDVDRHAPSESREWYAFILAARPVDMRPFASWRPQYGHPRKDKTAQRNS